MPAAWPPAAAYLWDYCPHEDHLTRLDFTRDDIELPQCQHQPIATPETRGEASERPTNDNRAESVATK